ncbi:cysteine desulfurase-like protein [Deinococcus irradiatisoli]|uniref:Cysteine desulfurase-like protein n=1 Tax=Deinococcus irradiatisoli TaxID=2202254 RepID=A0A2Z3JJZ8_9DEIO|nr:cysteine desulfurase-like protein [Deinococcus irradiatisoli]AWN23891.1 cysteine desulfurase-like protein [Deinococcus irradiatisoli]
MTLTQLSHDQIRAQFPPLESGLIYLDNAAGGLLPRRSIEAVTRHLTRLGGINSTPGHAPGQEVSALKTLARDATATFINARPDEVALGQSSTALNFRLAAAFARMWGEGDEVIISELDHEANASPWRELSRVGVEVKVWRARDDMTLDLADLGALLTPRTRLVAVTAASNALGVTVDIPAVAGAAHASGAWLMVDAVHASPHMLPDVQAWNCDFMCFSPYKVWGPHLGALYVRRELLAQLPVPKLSFVADDDITKLEHGTPQFELLAGWIGTLDYLRELGGHEQFGRPALEAAYRRIHQIEAPLLSQLLGGLLAAPGVTVYGPPNAAQRVGTVGLRVEGEAPLATAERLSKAGVSVAAGHFYAVMPMQRLGLYPDGVLRVSLAHYNSPADIDALLGALV